MGCSNPLEFRQLSSTKLHYYVMDKISYCIARKSCVVQRSMQEFNRSWFGILLLSLYGQIPPFSSYGRNPRAAPGPRLFLILRPSDGGGRNERVEDVEARRGGR